MKVNFRAENGLAPYFIYENLKFFIKDENIGKGNYRYTCYVKNLNKKYLEFTDEKEAKAYVQERKGVRFTCQYCDKVLYTSILAEYVICKNQVEVRNTARPLTGDFDNYNDCLLVAKIKVVDYIRLLDPQISLFA